ncbi:hypothetical protein OC846_003940 [Tilletia horrida]|uniref:Indoleamine 2,3-dioxygenase n=1 Tax=Tilletia horrida TaxID=155126 RepID=A0AAN6GP28_9BASI|nr:hypothetical protein OC845_003953 [Tilletia horrida]KAK0549702.1 hypothetical protein OC846_003940 [Tilletia horrida]
MAAASYYPRWPDSNQDAEHWEIPPEHFLAIGQPSSSKHQLYSYEDQLLLSALSSDPRQQQQQQQQQDASSESKLAAFSQITNNAHHQEAQRFSSGIGRSSRQLNAAPAPAHPGFLPQISSAYTHAPTSTDPPAASIFSRAHLHHAVPTSTTAAVPNTHDDNTPFSRSRDASMPDISTLAAADFDIDVRSGFMPPEPPLERLEPAHYLDVEDVGVPWEDMLDRARTLPLRCGGGGPNESEQSRRAAWQWRRDIRKLSVRPLSEKLATDIRHARRAHLVLSFLAHFYIHSQPPPISRAQLDQEAGSAPSKAHSTSPWLSKLGLWTAASETAADTPEETAQRPHLLGLEDEDDRADYVAERLGDFASTIPASIAVPWCALSTKLDLPPILTYATTVLWNWTVVNKALPPTHPGNLKITTTFTGTRSEEWFYLTSALIEFRGVEALGLMRRSLDEAFLADSKARQRLTGYLLRLANVISDLERILREVRLECDPAMFYFAIRPWFRGADDAQGWHYEGVDPPGVKRALNGPSAGQSSLIHALDQFLAVEHSAEENTERPSPPPTSAPAPPAATTTTTTTVPPSNGTFMQKMSHYMPGHHRRFLEHLRKMSVEDSMLESQRELENARAAAAAELRELQAQAQKSEAARGASSDKADDPASAALPALTHPSVLAASSTLHPIRRLALTPNIGTQKRPVSSDLFRPTPLSRAYDAALYALKSLRDEHMRIATLYIITQARRGAPPEGVRSWLPGSFTGSTTTSSSSGGADESLTEPCQSSSSSGGGEAKGTGGTPLVSFLKECRSNTVKALLEPELVASKAAAGVVKVKEKLKAAVSNTLAAVEV